MKINGAPVVAKSWSHTEILVIIPDLPQGTQATVQVFVGGQASNVAPFSKPVPNIDARVAQGSWTAMDTRGGQLMWIGGVLDLVGVPPASLTTAVSIDGRPCTMLNMTVDNGLLPTNPSVSFRLYFLTPAGALSCARNACGSNVSFLRSSLRSDAGFGQNLPVVISQLSAASRSENNILFNYAPPVITDVTPTPSISDSRRLALGSGIPTLGANVTVSSAIAVAKKRLTCASVLRAAAFRSRGRVSRQQRSFGLSSRTTLR